MSEIQSDRIKFKERPVSWGKFLTVKPKSLGHAQYFIRAAIVIYNGVVFPNGTFI